MNHKYLSFGTETVTVKHDDKTIKQYTVRNNFQFRGYGLNDLDGLDFWDVTKEEEIYLTNNLIEVTKG